MRYVGVGMLCVAMLSCREVLPVSVSPPTVQGYQLNGVVYSTNGVALENVEVRLYYNFRQVGYSPIDTQKVVITNSQSIYNVAVVTPAYEYVNQIFYGHFQVGTTPRATWNGLDQYGNPVPSGKYLIRYMIDTVVVKYSTVIINGHLTATTDHQGRFTLASDRLPVGEQFDYYNTENTFIGTYQVDSLVFLDFRKLSQHTQYPSVALQKGTITNGVFTLE